MSKHQQAPTMTEEDRKTARRYNRIHNEIEATAPIYDVEYQIETEDERDAMMKAHSMLNDDLDQMNVPKNTSFNENMAPDGFSSVTIVVAVKAKRSVFDSARAVWLADPQDTHWLWCCKDFDTDETLPVLPDEDDDGEWEFEDEEMEFLR